MHRLGRYALGIFLVAAGTFHFIRPELYLKMMPSYLPYPDALIFISGAGEVGLGIGLLIPAFARLAAWGTILLFIAVFPANVYLALHPELFPDTAPVIFWLRLPFQLVFIFWAYQYAKPGEFLDSVKGSECR